MSLVYLFTIYCFVFLIDASSTFAIHFVAVILEIFIFHHMLQLQQV